MRTPNPALLVIPFLGATAWFAIGIDSLIREGPHDERDIALLAPWLLSLASYSLVHFAQREQATALARRGFYVVAAAMIAAAIGQFGVILDVVALKALAAVGLVGWVAGMTMFGWGTFRTNVFPRHLGLGIIASEPGSIALGVAFSPIAGLHNTGSYSGGIANGVVVLLIGIALVRQWQANHSREMAATVPAAA